MASLDEVPGLIKRLYKVVDRLEQLFPGRKFTPDGHLVGSIGEVTAAHLYDLELLPGSTERHDAKAPDGTLVQVKATQRRMIGISSKPVHLLVLKLHRNGKATTAYNGPGKNAWDAAGPMQKNGQRPVSLSKLAKVMEMIPQEQRLAQVRDP